MIVMNMKKKIILAAIVTSIALLSGFMIIDYMEHHKMKHHESNRIQPINVMHQAFGPAKEWAIGPLKGGLSGASIFVAEDKENHKYVVRYFDHLPHRDSDRLIRNQLGASAAGFGPKVHWFDSAHSVIVMDFLEPEEPTNVYQNLAILLRKIHNSPKLGETGRLWEAIHPMIEDLRKVDQNLLDIDLVKSTFDSVIEQVTPNLESKTCHRDLNPTNIIFSKGQFYAVDYDSIGIDDPHIDLAQVAIFYCNTQNINTQEAEREFLTLYLGHAPTDAELKKFEAFKKIAYISFGVGFARLGPIDGWGTLPELMPFKNYKSLLGQGKLNLEDPRERLRFGLILLREAMDGKLKSE
jgi:thiamine kinase-like enzyme